MLNNSCRRWVTRFVAGPAVALVVTTACTGMPPQPTRPLTPQAEPSASIDVSPTPGGPDVVEMFAVLNAPSEARQEPSEESHVVTELQPGRVVFVLRSESIDGQVWFRVQLPPIPQGYGLFAWVHEPAAGGLLTPADQPCPPAAALDIGFLGGMHPETQLRCGRARAITLTGFLRRAELPAMAEGTPEWLVDSPQYTLTAGGGAAADGPLVWAHAHPDTMPVVIDQWVEVSAVIDHPEAAGCPRTVLDSLSSESDEEAERWCRQQLVMTSVVPIPPP